ncbi:MAG: hypothetical protein WAK95_21875 [Desulfobacterales bacterium]
MKRGLLVLVLAGALFGGCTYYPPAPGTYVTTPAGSFERSWAAATGAFQDQGVRVTSQDRSLGIVRGTRDGIDVTANVRTQADGSVRVEFTTGGATERDPGLIDRISQSYDRRMGR